MAGSATNYSETCAGRVALGWSAMCLMGVGFKIFDKKVTPQPPWQQKKVQEGSANEPLGSPCLLFVSWLKKHSSTVEGFQNDLRWVVSDPAFWLKNKRIRKRAWPNHHAMEILIMICSSCLK